MRLFILVFVDLRYLVCNFKKIIYLLNNSNNIRLVNYYIIFNFYNNELLYD